MHVDVELTSVRRIACRDLITVTNTFTDTTGERVHTLHTTVVGVTAEDLNSEIKTAVHNAMMHDVDIFGIGESEYQKTVRQAGEVRVAQEARPARQGHSRSMMQGSATSYPCTTPDCPAATL